MHMGNFESIDWASGTAESHLELARRATDDQLRHLARTYDWRLFPEPVLGWVMAQRAIDLGTALTCFFNGEPERFNYLAKRDIPEQHRSTARLLDNICLRVNSGFYLALHEETVDQEKRLQNWLTYQSADRRERRRGRWILDEQILEALTSRSAAANQPDPPQDASGKSPQTLRDKLRGGPLKRALSPLLSSSR